MEAAHLVVARFLKPHGLKGEAVVLPLTDEPEEVFVPGRRLCPVDTDGNPIGDPLVIARARPFHRRWLLWFEGLEDRSELEQWPQHYLGAQAAELRPPNDDELYVHEIPGAAVMENDGRRLTAIPFAVDGDVGWYDEDGRSLTLNVIMYALNP